MNYSSSIPPSFHIFCDVTKQNQSYPFRKSHLKWLTNCFREIYSVYVKVTIISFLISDEKKELIILQHWKLQTQWSYGNVQLPKGWEK